MELIRKKILLENYIDRNDYSPTYGSLTATSFYVNVMLTQNIDDMAMFTDAMYIPLDIGASIGKGVDYSILINKLNASGFTFPFMTGAIPTNMPTNVNPYTRVVGKNVSDYYFYTNNVITGITDSRVEDVRSYNNLTKYDLNFDTNSEVYTNYLGQTVNGVDRVTMLGTGLTYVFAAGKNDPDIGTINQKNGLVFNELSGATLSKFSFSGEGWNMTNISLSALTKEEYLFGIISRPEVKNDVFIDRGIVTVFDRHLKLSEITNITQLARYGDGYYNII